MGTEMIEEEAKWSEGLRPNQKEENFCKCAENSDSSHHDQPDGVDHEYRLIFFNLWYLVARFKF
jgi:hypothetical protein